MFVLAGREESTYPRNSRYPQTSGEMKPPGSPAPLHNGRDVQVCPSSSTCQPNSQPKPSPPQLTGSKCKRHGSTPEKPRCGKCLTVAPSQPSGTSESPRRKRRQKETSGHRNRRSQNGSSRRRAGGQSSPPPRSGGLRSGRKLRSNQCVVRYNGPVLIAPVCSWIASERVFEMGHSASCASPKSG